MTQDYKARSKHRARGATAKPTAPPPPQKKPLPGWLWLLTGFALAFLLMWLRDLGLQPSLNPAPQAAVKSAPADKASSVSETLSERPQTQQPKFDFYDLLPESTVVLPDAPVVETTPSQELKNVIFVLQAGAFRAAADAERRRAEIILSGYQASIEQSEIKAGQTWHRVFVGPFESKSQLAKARADLLQNNIDTLVVQRNRDS